MPACLPALPAGDKRTAEDNHEFLLRWLDRFPQFRSNPFYLSGGRALLQRGLDRGLVPLLEPPAVSVECLGHLQSSNFPARHVTMGLQVAVLDCRGS